MVQKSLLEFFEIIERSDWQLTLREIIKSSKLDIWEIDVSKLAEEYMQRLKKEQDLNKIATGLLVCTIILKHKSRKLHLKELEEVIEEELEEINEITENEPNTLLENDQEQVPLSAFEKSLEKVLGVKKVRKKYEKKEKTIYIPIAKEDFATTASKLLNFLQQNGKKTYYYEEILEKHKPENNLFMTLLYLNNNEKIKLEQKEFYDKLKIKVKGN